MESPEHIKLLVQQWQTLNDDDILAKILALPVLPDEDDTAWDNESTWNDQADPFVALADICEQRKLLSAIPLLLERASYGDPGEMMRGLRHSFEAIVCPNWHHLAEICVMTATYSQRGARLWSIRQLGILRELFTLDVLLSALKDDAKLVRREACISLTMLCQKHPSCRNQVISALQQAQHTLEEYGPQNTAQWAYQEIQKLG